MGHQFSVLIRVTVNSLVAPGPCVLLSATIAAEGAAADCDIYNGKNANAPSPAHLEALSGTTFHLDLEGPALFENGIFVEVNASTTHVMVEYIPLSQAQLIARLFELED